MPALDTIRRALRRGGNRPQTVRCRDCDADFSLSDVENAVDVACPFCGATDVRIRG